MSVVSEGNTTERKITMEIAIIASDSKKELITQFCIAYCGILSRHHLCATQKTGKYISDATGLEIDLMMSGSSGGTEQIASRISFNEIDALFFFPSTDPTQPPKELDIELLRMCDIHNIPVATNIATAEVLVMAIEQGALDWREFVNPRSQYNRNRPKL